MSEKKAWNSEKGRWARDRKAASENGKLGAARSAEVRKAKAAAKKLLEDKNEFILEAAAQVTVEDPEWFTKMLATLISISEDESADPSVRMNAMDRISAMIGTKAPMTKQVEVKQEKPMTPEEAAKVIQQANLKVVGDGS